jgi:hypothetical protein
MLEPKNMVEKIIKINEAASRYLEQIPNEKLDTLLPGRPRSYRQLVYHIFNIQDVFLRRVEDNEPYTYESLLSILPKGMETKEELASYGNKVRKKFSEWWLRDGITTNFKQPGNVYYGEVILHEVLERTAWHSGQHARQVALMLKEKLNLVPNEPIEDEVFQGLPMPKNIWDNERSFSEGSYSGQALSSVEDFKNL